MTLRDQVEQKLTDVLDVEMERCGQALLDGKWRATILAALGPVLDAAEQPKTCSSCHRYDPKFRGGFCFEWGARHVPPDGFCFKWQEPRSEEP